MRMRRRYAALRDSSAFKYPNPPCRALNFDDYPGSGLSSHVVGFLCSLWLGAVLGSSANLAPSFVHVLVLPR